MSNMCLIVTPSIKKVADQIKQEYPKACERNGFTDQMCAEWIGLYNNTNSQNPDNVPSMKSLVNFIEKLRNQEGKSFLRDLEEEKRQYDIEQEMADIKAKAIADGTFMKAPNDKPTNLTERQWLQVRTQNFINWFGDWINDSANASKVVDENGEPLVVYHHTDNPNLTKFSTDFENYFAKDGGTKEAIFFDEEKTGTLNRKYDLPVFLNIRELNEYNETKQQLHDRGTTYREIVNNSAKKNNKTGGVHMKDFDDNKKEHQSIWIIHNPNQVKSATDNNGMFSTENDSILASPAQYEEIPVELMEEMADEEAFITALDSRESSDPDLDKKFGNKTETTVSEVLDNMLKLGTPLEGFVRALKDNLGELGNIKIKLVPNSNSKIYGIGGLYSTADNTIYINKNGSYRGKNGKVDNTIVHEIVHAIVANSLNTPKHREELGKIFDEAREKILKKYGVESFDALPEYLRKGRLYGLQNLDEFAAEFFTNSEFISELNDENTFGKRSSKKSLFNRLVEWIKSLLPKGVTETYKRSGKILEDILLNSGRSIQANRNLLASRNSATNTINQENNRLNNQIEYDNDFRRVQETSRKLVQEGKPTTYQRGDSILDESTRSSLATTYTRLLSQRNGAVLGQWVSLSGKGNQFKVAQVTGTVFHDIFEINRNYLKNGELVDLHDTYDNCKCYLTEDGLAGFAIEENGNLISVFSLNPAQKGGFLYAIKDHAIAEGATHLDAYNSSKQPLRIIYEKVFGAKVASSMDYNMEFDHDNIAENHGNPQVVFMVMGEAAKGKVIEKHFNKDQYDEAEAYQHSFLPQTTLASPQASQINPLFRQGIETLAGYYEGGGRLITDDFPGVPKELDDKLDNHFMGGEELSDDDYRELSKYISVVKNTDANTSQSWPYIAVPKQQTQQQSKFNVSQAEFYSGAAMGSDTAWAKEARKLGIKVVDYTVGNYEALSPSEKAKYDAEYKEVARTIGKNESPEGTYTGKLLRRDMMQADSADAIFAIGTLNSRGFVEGGTGYATTRGIIRGIPVFVYDRRNKQWKIWSTSSRKFINTSEPTLTPHAAVIGTRGEVVGKDDRGRDIYDIKEEEKQVIRNILTKTVGQQSAQQQTQRQKIASAIKTHSGYWSRTEAEKHPRTLYVFTDNLDRDSGSGIILPGSWYSKRYGVGHHYPSSTAAVVRGLDNARPISTMHYFYKSHGYAHPKYNRDSKALWHDSDIEEFKRVVRSELQDIVDEFNTGRYDTIMFPSGDGLFNTELSNITKYRTPKLYQALADLLHEYGFDSLIPADAQPSSVSSSSGAEETDTLAAGATTFGSAPTAEQQAGAQKKYEEANAPRPRKSEPTSDSFKTALKVTENRTTQFYQTFTPQQIKDRGIMIADYFSDIIDDYIMEQQDILLDNIDSYNGILNDKNTNEEEMKEAQNRKDEDMQLLNLLRDPVNGRQYAANKIQIGNIIDQIKNKIKRNIDSHEGTEKQLWQNTLDYFEELFNNQASLEIEEQEGIRIIGLKIVEKSSDETESDEQNDGNDETGHTVSGNDGWLFETRFENPASSLSKKVRRMTYNIKRGEQDKDDLGHTRKYPNGQIYATLLSYMAKHVQNPDDFMQVTMPDDYDGTVYDHYGNEVTRQLYPYGYPTFPALEKMREQYPWVEQVINRLTDDYLDSEWNTCIAYPSTYGAMASQFYINFRKAFIPSAKIQVGTDKDGKPYFGVTPLNTEMEARCQRDKLKANFSNGIVLTDTGIYNQDTSINREHAQALKDEIKKVIDGGEVEHAYRIYMDLSDPDLEIEEEDSEEFNDFTDNIVYLLNSFGISSNRENVIALLAQEDQGNVLLNMLKDLQYIADTVSKVSDEKAKDFNYIIDLTYVGGEKVWNKFFDGRGLITDESYMQSFYDSASKKTRYSYSADNYIQKTFRGIFNPNLEERRKYIDEKFKKYEWFYNHKTNTWRNKWLERLYDAQDITDVLPYRNINNISEYENGVSSAVREYSKWSPDDVWLVQNRGYDDNSPYAYYLAPIFSDAPMSMTVRGPVLGNTDVLDAFVGLVDQEMWRMQYAAERAKAIEAGIVKPIANFDVIDGKGGRAFKFCFIPELNTFKFENGESFMEAMNRMKNNKDENGNDRTYSKEEIEDVQRAAIMSIMRQKARDYYTENARQYENDKNFDEEVFLNRYMNMAYANAAIIQLTTIDLAFYKNALDFQKRFKEAYAGGMELNTNSRYAHKTENVVLLADDIITSPSYDAISDIINGSKNLLQKDKEHILEAFKGVNVADAQAIRAMHSFRSVLDMMGKWDDRMQEALDRFSKGTWDRQDFDILYQTIKPFVYAVIERNDGIGGTIPVPQQHKNSEICALMMYDVITNNLNSPVYRALSRFMELKDANGDYLIHMAQYESAGKVGNQGVININFNASNVMKAISKEWDDSSERDREIRDLLDKHELKTARKKINGREVTLPNDVDNAVDNYKAIKEQLDAELTGKKISQEDYNKIMAYLRPTEDEIFDILTQKALIKQEDGYVINPEVVHTIPMENYYQAQPTPAHHVDAEATFGSQGRNISVADLPDDFTLTVEVKGGKHTFKGKDALIDFYYELLDENLIEDFFGSETKKGLKEIFASKENLLEAITDMVRGNPKYGKDFIDALKLDEDGNFTLSPNSPTMLALTQELITSLFKNRITKQKIHGAALIQAAGIGLDDNLRLVKDKSGKIVGAQCLMPLTSKKFFEPLLKTDEEGRKYFDINDLPEELKKAVGYRIPTENKSSMLPLYIVGFTPQQNGSAIILPAEITALAGSDFDVDKMFIMLSEFYIQNYDMKSAREKWAEEELYSLDVFKNPDLEDEVSNDDPEEFRKWFKKNKEDYKLEKPRIKRVEYDWSKSPKENGRKARNNMIIQIIYGILTSEAGNESLLNPQGFDNLKAAAKLNKIITDPVLKSQLLKNYGEGVVSAVPSAEQIRKMFLEKYSGMEKSRYEALKKTLAMMPDEAVVSAYVEASVAGKDDVATLIMNTSLKDREKFIDMYSMEESPVYPQTFAHCHARNMAGANQLGIYAIQASMCAKYQRAHINIKEKQQFTVNGRVIKNVDVSDNGKRLKNNGEMVGGCADNGKDPNLSDAGSTTKTAPIIGYMLRAGLSHEEAVLIINQPIMKEFNFSSDKMERGYPGIKDMAAGDVSSITLIKAIINPLSISPLEQNAIDAMCYRILKQAKEIEGLTMISRADSPNGAMQNTFAKARVQQYMVELFNAKMGQPEFPFYPIREAINNTAIDVSKGEDAVREALKAQPMAFLHAMYALGINSINDLASPYFFMLTKDFDDSIVKPILYNQKSDRKEYLEELVNKIYLQYITYVLSSSPLFGDEKNADGSTATMKDKRDYYLTSFADDFAEILQKDEEIRNLLGGILRRSGNRIVLEDVGSLAKGQKDAISRRFDALIALGKKGNKSAKKLATQLLLYAYYDSGLNFTHDSFSTRLSTYFLSQFPAFREVLQQLNIPLTDEQKQNFIYQFLITNKEAAFKVDKIISEKENIVGGRIVVAMNDRKMSRRFTDVILSPNPRGEGVQPYPYISYKGEIYVLDTEAYANNGATAEYIKLEGYPTNDVKPIYNINKSLTELSEEYNAVEPAPQPTEDNITVDGSADIAHNTSNDNPDTDNDEDDDFSNLESIDDVETPGPASPSNRYEEEGKSSLESEFC